MPGARRAGAHPFPALDRTPGPFSLRGSRVKPCISRGLRYCGFTEIYDDRHNRPAGRISADDRGIGQRPRRRPEMIRRALALCRQFAFSPWVAWAVVEGKTTLAEAAPRLDRRLQMCRLADRDPGSRSPASPTSKRGIPMRPLFLAHDLTVAGGGPMRRIAEALVVARAVQPGERGASPDDDSAPRVRREPIARYRAPGRSDRAVARREGLSLETALEVALGDMPLGVARRRMAIRRAEADRPEPVRSGFRRPGGGPRTESPRSHPRHGALQDDRYT